MFMYDRYHDRSKFITDSNQLKIEDDTYVYISLSKDYDITIDLDERVDEFEQLKPFIIFLTGHICELDNIAQRFSNLRNPNIDSFPHDLMIIYIDKPNIVKLEYWGELENTVFDAVFIYTDQRFKLIQMGMVDNIPDDWEEQLMKNADLQG